MNKITPNIPNKIKQPAQCCIYCGKSYVKKTSLNKHIIICELLNKSKNRNLLLNEEIEDEIPSQKKLFQMLIELGNKYNKLEEKVEELNKWVIKKKKKINVIEWLNTNIIPQYKFETLIEKIIIDQEDVKYLFENSFNDTLNKIFAKTIYNLSENEYPIFAFAQKTNMFYIYENENEGWIELTREKLVRFLNRVHMKLLKIYCEWKKINSTQIQEDEALSILCDKTSLKMMNVDFKQETIYGKIKNNMYSRMKMDMKALIEYEFEF